MVCLNLMEIITCYYFCSLDVLWSSDSQRETLILITQQSKNSCEKFAVSCDTEVGFIALGQQDLTWEETLQPPEARFSLLCDFSSAVAHSAFDRNRGNNYIQYPSIYIFCQTNDSTSTYLKSIYLILFILLSHNKWYFSPARARGSSMQWESFQYDDKCKNCTERIPLVTFNYKPLLTNMHLHVCIHTNVISSTLAT